jgi:hypothetical protein
MPPDPFEIAVAIRRWTSGLVLRETRATMVATMMMSSRIEAKTKNSRADSAAPKLAYAARGGPLACKLETSK